jgi:hypothetical protein
MRRALYPRRIEQSLAADGAIACFSSSLFSNSLNADRAPQLKANVRQQVEWSERCIEATSIYSLNN